MMAIATAAKQIIYDGMDIAIGGGIESVSLVQNQNMNTHRMIDRNLLKLHKDAYMPMLATAETVAKRYGISREAQDEYGSRAKSVLPKLRQQEGMTTRLSLLPPLWAS